MSQLRYRIVQAHDLRLRVCAALTSFLLLTGFNEPGDRGYETEWKVTQTVPEEFSAPRQIEKQSIVFQQRLTFENLARADAPLVQASNSEEFIPAGEQYYKALTSPEHELWCTANMKMPQNEFAKNVVGRVYSQYCIYDNDKDGVFDAFFKRARTIAVAPTVRGKIRSFERMRAIQPIRLTAIDPSELRTDYYWGIGLDKVTSKGPRFVRFAGSEFGLFPLEKPVRGAPGQNQLLEVDGASISYSVVDKELIIHGFEPLQLETIRIHGTNCGAINGC